MKNHPMVEGLRTSLNLADTSIVDGPCEVISPTSGDLRLKGRPLSAMPASGLKSLRQSKRRRNEAAT